MNEPRHTYKTKRGPYYQGTHIEVLAEALDGLKHLGPAGYSQKVALIHHALCSALQGKITPADFLNWLLSSDVNPTKPE